MNKLSEYGWRKYKSDFLTFNQCTDKEFERAYVAFMGSFNNKPSTKAYRQFARKYGITIEPDLNLSEDDRVFWSVTISVIKVMAKTFAESETAIKEIFEGQK